MATAFTIVLIVMFGGMWTAAIIIARRQKKETDRHRRRAVTAEQAIDDLKFSYEMKIAALENNIDHLAEKRAQKIIRSWEPDPLTAEEEFLRAERMANKRAMVNNGRRSMPPENTGEPSKVSRINLRGK